MSAEAPIPSGLKGFAARIQRNLHQPPPPEQKKQAREEQLRIKEALKILKKLRVEEKLEYIKETVWQGKGEIFPIDKGEAPFHGNYSNELATAGFLLVNYYPACRLVTEAHSAESPNTKWTSVKYILETRATRLYVEVFHGVYSERENRPDSPGRVENNLRIFSGIYSSTARGINTIGKNSESPVETIMDVDIPINATDLDNALAEEIRKRVEGNFLPAQLEQEAGEELSKAKRSPAWKKWVTVTPEYEIYTKTVGYLRGGLVE